MLTEPIQPLVIVYTASIGALGIVALIYQRTWLQPNHPSGVAPWQASWIHFGLFLWLIFTSILLAQSLANLFQDLMPSDSTWQMALLGTCTHLSLLAVFLVNALLKTPLTPQNFGQSTQPIAKAFKSALVHFLRLIPLLYLWGLCLSVLEKQGVLPPVEMQPMVQIILEAPSPWLLIVFGILAVFIAPVSEELLFRGALYPFLKARLSPKVALGLSALIFAAFHFPTLAYALPLFLLGLALGHSYESTNDLRVPILFHAVFNLNTLIIILLQRQ